MESVGTVSGGAPPAEVSQYLTFRIGAEEYGLEILRVQEIKGYGAVTALPNTPRYLKGVMNLRGTIIPIIDLRLKLGLEAVEYTAFTVVIVVRAGASVVGLVVDSVSDVLDIPVNDIQPTPDFGHGVDTRLIHGVSQTGDTLVVLLNLDAVLSSGTVAALEATTP
jgi:purine-binding chemotaxis protein CheW